MTAPGLLAPIIFCLGAILFALGLLLVTTLLDHLIASPGSIVPLNPKSNVRINRKET